MIAVENTPSEQSSQHTMSWHVMGRTLVHLIIYSVNIKMVIQQVKCCSFQMHGGSAKFSDLYELQEDIGVGSYSICKRCVHRVSAMDYAVKVNMLCTNAKFL